jgi:enhancing lycopene biosynthesis protein 2
MAKVGVVLSGCGVMDGAEIHESVLTLLALDDAGASYQCMAPDTDQLHVINHLTGQPENSGRRNVLVESARIARGRIIDLAGVNVADYDAFMFPGGFGAAKNLSTFAIDGKDCSVNADVARLVREAHSAGKPIAFVCIAPVVAAKVLGSAAHTKLTIGDDSETAQAINEMGAEHIACPVKEAVIDEDNRIISSPAYMKAGNLSELYEGIRGTVRALLKMADKTAAAV